MLVEKSNIVKVEKVEKDKRKICVEPDRITFYLGRKISDGDYGNVSVGLTYSSSMRENEILEDTEKRVIDYVENKVIDKTQEIVDSIT